MRRFLALLLFAAIMAPLTGYASIYGTLKGKVVDKQGEPVAGASVLVMGTAQGTYAKEDGSFMIVKIKAGSIDVKVSAINFQDKVLKGVRVSQDETTTINIVMETGTDVVTDVVEVVADKLVSQDEIGSQSKFNNEEITNVAGSGALTDVIGLSSGVSITGGGISMRGSRGTETKINVDGQDRSNQFTGGFGAAGGKYFPMVSVHATEEVQVVKGGMSAEHGDVLGGVVNTVVKQGRTDKYQGYLLYSTDLPSLYGRQRASIEVEREGNLLFPVEKGEGAKLLGSNEINLDGGVSGPIPFLTKHTFSLSARSFYEEFRNNNYDINDPLGNSIGQLPNNQSWVKNITGRLTFNLAQGIRLVAGGDYGITALEFSSWGWLYSNDVSPITGMTERVAKQLVENVNIYNGYAQFQHTYSETGFYEVKLSYSATNDELGRRVNADGPNFFSGFTTIKPEDNYISEGTTLIQGKDKVLDHYQRLSEITTTVDGYRTIDRPGINPLTGFREGGPNSSGTNNPWGFQLTPTHGNNSYVSYRYGTYTQADGTIQQVITTADFNHEIHGGAEMKFYTMHRHYNGMPYDGNPFYDVATDMWGGNLYADADNYSVTSKPFEPWRASAFVYDLIKYKQLVFTPGLRMDMFDPNSSYRTSTTQFAPIREIGNPEKFADASLKFYLSPRMNITYPISERSKITLNYSVLYEMPKLQYLYDNFGLNSLRGNNILGNPNMEAQRVNSYEVTYANEIADGFAFSINSYYKDIYNQLGVRKVFAVPDPFFEYTVAEYGNSKGIEFEFQRRVMNNIGFRINYALAENTGTSASPADNYNVITDPYTGLWAYPLGEYPLGNDIRHTVNMILNLVWGDNEGPSIGGLHVLENTVLGFTGSYQSGSPYTRTDINGRPISEINAERNPDYWNVDLRASRTVLFKDLVGDMMGDTKMEIYFDVFNLLNRREAVGYYSATGDPDDDGVSLNRSIGDFSSVSWYKEAVYGMPLTYSPEQYDTYGNRLYNSAADFDNNGIVTQAEKYETYINYIEMLMKFRGMYQAPRQVSFGVKLMF